MQDRVIEYVDHLHEHFRHPVRIDRAHYRLSQDPGYSIEILPESLDQYQFPDGAAWRSGE